MDERIEKARQAVRNVLKEFAPAKDRAVGAGKELLLAMREVIDAEIRLFEKATAKKEPPGAPKEPCPPKAPKAAGKPPCGD
jgi:hypothetical protein